MKTAHVCVLCEMCEELVICYQSELVSAGVCELKQLSDDVMTVGLCVTKVVLFKRVVKKRSFKVHFSVRIHIDDDRKHCCIASSLLTAHPSVSSPESEG